MTIIVKYSRLSSPDRSISADIDVQRERAVTSDFPKSKESQVKRPISLTIIQSILIIFCLTASTPSFSSFKMPFSQCIAASESDAPEVSEGNEKKESGTESSSTEDDEDDCD